MDQEQKSYLYVMMGLPACGKSTIVEKINDGTFKIISTDNMLELIAEQQGKTYDEIFDREVRNASKMVMKDLAHVKAMKHNAIWDQTNLTKKHRLKILKHFNPDDYRRHCIALVPPRDDAEMAEWRKRLNSRPGKTIPVDVMERMINQYTPINTVEEEFDIIEYFDMFGKRADPPIGYFEKILMAILKEEED